MTPHDPDPGCDAYADYVSAAVDGELDPESARILDAHLAGCARCRRDLAEFGALRRRMLVGPVPRMDALLTRIGPSRLAAAVGYRHRVRRAGLVAVACSIIVGLALGLFVLQPHQPEPLHTAASGGTTGSIATVDTIGMTTHDPVTTVKLADQRSETSHVVVDRGDDVRWVNTDPAVHHLVIHSAGARIDNLLEPSAAETITFTEPGTFRFDCVIHPSLSGTVTVR